MEPRNSVDRTAARTRLALVAGLVDIGEIIAPRALAQIARRGRLIAQLLRRSGEDGLGKHRIVGANPRMVGRRSIGCLSADAQTVTLVSNLIHRERVYIDQRIGRFDLQLHKIEQIGPARNCHRAVGCGLLAGKVRDLRRGDSRTAS